MQARHILAVVAAAWLAAGPAWPAEQAEFQPGPPYYATFFYPWFPNWSDRGHSPPRNWFSNYLPDLNPCAFHPATELYDSNDDATIYWQLAKMAEARLAVAISSWWGPLHKTDWTFRHILNDVMNRPENPYPNLRWALYYEKESLGDPAVVELVNDLNYIKSSYTSQRGHLKIGGRPVIFVYASGSDGAGMAGRWRQARAETGFYVVLKVYSGYKADPNQPDNWHQYAPANRTDSQPPYSFMVSPGFWLDGEPPRLPRDISAFRQAVADLVRRGELSDTEYGEPMRLIEEQWAKYLGVEFALSRVDGTAALHSACFAAGIGPGDEVLVQSYTWVASVGCILAAGGVPVFADIDPRTYTLDPADVERRVTPRTKAILPVHLWGHPTEMDEIMRIAGARHLRVIEDASHAHGGTYRGRKVGTIGDIGCFSMQASKSLPAGEGGMMVTNDRRLFERALLLAQSPGRLKLHIQLPEHRPFIDTGFGGFKYRMNVLNAVIARLLLPKLDRLNAVRQKNMDHLSARLAGIPGIQPPYTAPHVTRGGFYGYPVLYTPEELDNLPLETFLKAVNAEGVPLKRDRYMTLHLCALYGERNPVGHGWAWSFSEATRAIKYQPGDLPVTEALYPRLLHLESWDKAEPCQALFDQYALGIRKVAENAPQLAAQA